MGSEQWGDVAMVAHELRSPLAAVRVAAELLREEIDQVDVLDVEHSRKMAQMLHRGALWLQQLVDNLACLEAARAGELARDPQALDLHDVARGIVPIVEPLFAAKGQRLEIQVPQSPLWVAADRQQLGQVCVNLLANASKFSPAASVVCLKLSHDGELVRVAVEDRGPGIPADCTAHLFDLFYQAPMSTAPEQRGVGLGLAIVKAIVLAHGGKVGAENRRRGGARVWFELPRLQRSVRAEASGTVVHYGAIT
jgi:two-component system CheB/CheR fusion protein